MTTHTRNIVNSLTVGSRFIDCLDCLREVVEIKDGFYICKWVQEDGKLSLGSEYRVPSHFDFDKYDRLV